MGKMVVNIVNTKHQKKSDIEQPYKPKKKLKTNEIIELPSPGI